MALGEDFADGSAALAQALLASAADPGDAIRLLLPLAGFMPEPFHGTGGLAATLNTAQDVVAATMRCAACAALGQAAGAYAPQSYQDAQAVRQAVCGALDAEATRAADAGRDATYQALRTLRTAVALDLALRGASLALLVEVRTAEQQPSLAEAWTLYHDPSREPGLVASANPSHPLWMPVDFQALQF